MVVPLSLFVSKREKRVATVWRPLRLVSYDCSNANAQLSYHDPSLIFLRRERLQILFAPHLAQEVRLAAMVPLWVVLI
jgi:hypothetical protein